MARESRINRELGEAIQLGLYPFRPRQITLFLEDNWPASGAYHLQVEFSNFPSLNCTILVDKHELMMFGEAVVWGSSLGPKIVSMLKDWRRIDPEENIILGEE